MGIDRDGAGAAHRRWGSPGMSGRRQSRSCRCPTHQPAQKPPWRRRRPGFLTGLFPTSDSDIAMATDDYSVAVMYLCGGGVKACGAAFAVKTHCVAVGCSWTGWKPLQTPDNPTATRLGVRLAGAYPPSSVLGLYCAIQSSFLASFKAAKNISLEKVDGGTSLDLFGRAFSDGGPPVRRP